MNEHTIFDKAVNDNPCEVAMRDRGWHPTLELTCPENEPPVVSAFRTLFDGIWDEFVDEIGEDSAIRFFNSHSLEFSHAPNWRVLMLQEGNPTMPIILPNYGLFLDYDRESIPPSAAQDNEGAVAWVHAFDRAINEKLLVRLLWYNDCFIAADTIVERQVVAELARRYTSEDVNAWIYTLCLLWLYKDCKPVSMHDVTNGVFGNMLVSRAGMLEAQRDQRRLGRNSVELDKCWDVVAKLAESKLDEHATA